MSDTLRAQLWPLPTLGVVLAVAAGVGLPRLDARIQHDIPPWLKDYLFGGGADAARTVLEAIAGSLISVTALTFSLTVVTLQLASSQFSPPAAAHVHRGPVRPDDPGAVPRDVRLRPDRAAHRADR
ncbi:DUF2254 family protein [Streptomyces sp. NPDC058625]|uniref:DUF2254 family protein n=1 Tax=Streptomyces sp. NPDC058625 TaxID=3346564 RepID=UPI003650DD4A